MPLINSVSVPWSIRELVDVTRCRVGDIVIDENYHLKWVTSLGTSTLISVADTVLGCVLVSLYSDVCTDNATVPEKRKVGSKLTDSVSETALVSVWTWPGKQGWGSSS